MVTVRHSHLIEETTVRLETMPGGHVIKWCKQEGYKEPVSATTPIKDKKVKEIISLLTDSCIPPLIEPAMGVDGYTVKVSAGNDWGGSHYYWWCSVPAGWEPLGKVVEILLDYVPKEIIDLKLSYQSSMNK